MSIALSLQIADWGGNVAYAQLPEDVIKAAQRAVFDTLGVIAAGAAHPVVSALNSVYGENAGPCSAIGAKRQLSASAAAMVNGAAAHAWDFDDTSYTGIMHGSTVVLPAALAAAQETDASEEDFIAAFIVGSEVAYTLAESCTHSHYFSGWWSTVTFGLSGATAAAARLYGLDRNQFACAMGMSAAAAGGGKVVFGTDGKPFLVGDTARRGIEFAKTAVAGLSGPINGFEKPGGFYALLNGGKFEAVEFETLGERWRLLAPGLMTKTSPVCSAAHAAIEQLACLMEEAAIGVEQVLRVEAEVPELVYISLIYSRPETSQQAQFSLPYALACTLLHGSVWIDDLDENEISSSLKRSLMERVSVTRSAELSGDSMRVHHPESAKITVHLTNGEIVSGFCGQAYGMPSRPLSETDLISKFYNCVKFARLQNVSRPQKIQKLLILSQEIISSSASL